MYVIYLFFTVVKYIYAHNCCVQVKINHMPDVHSAFISWTASVDANTSTVTCAKI
jgi:hypothetical protein